MKRALNYGNANPYSSQLGLINAFRKLWEQHIMWTRSFIISTAANLGDLDPVTKRLLRNPVDFENVLRRFYGDEKAAKFKELLTQHLLIAADLVNHAKAGNTQAAEADSKRWYANADEIAAFLASLNPYWSMREWQRLLYDHLKMTADEATYRLSGRYADDVAEYDIIEDEALAMADYMSHGIIRQFFKPAAGR